jgi:hypothetical protein
MASLFSLNSLPLIGDPNRFIKMPNSHSVISSFSPRRIEFPIYLTFQLQCSILSGTFDTDHSAGVKKNKGKTSQANKGGSFGKL